MTPGARLQAAIELIEASLPQDAAAIPPADRTIQAYVRARRYMGSRDRAWVTETVYGVLRAKARVEWSLARVGAPQPTARLRVFAWLLLAKGWTAEALTEACAIGAYAAAAPNEEEGRILRHVVLTAEGPVEVWNASTAEKPSPLGGEGRVRGEHGYLPSSLRPPDPPHPAPANPGLAPGKPAQPSPPSGGEGGHDSFAHPDQPDWVRFEYPEWLEGALLAAFGGRDALVAEMAAADRPAAVTLRVNRLKADPFTAVAALAEDGIDARPNPLLPGALDVPVRSRVEASRAWRAGLVEVQDAAAQIAARLVDARPGTVVCDYCAGAGGKTLALAAAMSGQGRIVACDVGAGRLKPLARRAERAGCADMLDGRILGRDPEPDAAAFDRVLVDAPCSGSGTWRRNPEAKWRLTSESLAELATTQDAILDRAAALVRPGGCLVYATCSVLPAENGARVRAFLDRHPAFHLVDAREVWRALSLGAPPFDGETMLLTPARHGTDGFFAAVMERGS